jgi:gliding motility-associated-like protein
VPVGRAGQFEFKVDNNDWSTQDVYENLTYDYPHTALVRDELGCEGMTVFVVTAPPIAIPDYFTPSEDGLNDTWDLSTIMDAYPNTKVTIYDRTGKVVAVLEGDVTDWDGTYNGYPLPSTDYWYLINVPEIRRQFTGHFTLIRTK